MGEPGKVVSTEKAPAILHLIPRVGINKEPLSLEIPFDGVVDANLQFCNAYEEGNKIVLDAIRSDGLKKLSPAKSSTTTSTTSSGWSFVSSREDYDAKASNRSLWRYEIELSSCTVSKRKFSDLQCFFGGVRPSQATQKHDHIFMAVGALGNEAAAPQVNTSLEDDGYVLTVLFNGKSEQSELLVFESSEISAGPVCRIPLGIGIPHGLHGCFTNSEETIWSHEEIQRRAKLADKIESRGNRWNEVKSDFSGLGLRFDDMEEYFGDSFLS